MPNIQNIVVEDEDATQSRDSCSSQERRTRDVLSDHDDERRGISARERIKNIKAMSASPTLVDFEEKYRSVTNYAWGGLSSPRHRLRLRDRAAYGYRLRIVTLDGN